MCMFSFVQQGMGGQLDYFGLWLSQEFGRGHSKAKPECTTFNSPQLSKSDTFQVHRLEVWGVGPTPAEMKANIEVSGKCADEN